MHMRSAHRALRQSTDDEKQTCECMMSSTPGSRPILAAELARKVRSAAFRENLSSLHVSISPRCAQSRSQIAFTATQRPAYAARCSLIWGDACWSRPTCSRINISSHEGLTMTSLTTLHVMVTRAACQCPTILMQNADHEAGTPSSSM